MTWKTHPGPSRPDWWPEEPRIVSTPLCNGVETIPNLPCYRGRGMRRRLTRRYGLPNAAPRRGESAFGNCRVCFIDEEKGRPVAYWVPEED
jgi:hypothetical protein